MSGTTARRRVLRVPLSGPTAHRADLLAVEEPLEIQVDGEPLIVTMRTPGHDIDLAASPCKRWHGGRDHDDRCVARPDFGRIDGQTHTPQHRTERLAAKASIVAVPRAI